MKVYGKRECPVCGGARGWKPGVVRHLLEAGNYVHIKFVNEGMWRICLLKDGKAVES